VTVIGQERATTTNSVAIYGNLSFFPTDQLNKPCYASCT